MRSSEGRRPLTAFVSATGEGTPDIPVFGLRPGRYGNVERIRAALVVAGVAVFTAPLMPVQALLRRLWPRGAALLPHHYHRVVCRLLGVRIEIRGRPIRDGACLMAANHSSWLDIPVLSACSPVSFVAKREVNGWGIFGTLARLQRTLFVDRDRRSRTAAFRDAMQRRLAAGDHLVLFPEGTSSDGNCVLPFKSALLGAADCMVTSGRNRDSRVRIQPVSIAYVRLHGLPMGRQYRPFFAWYGDMELVPHLWQALCLGPVDVVVHFHEPVTLDQFGDRKELARYCQEQVETGLMAALVNAAAPA